MTISEAFDAARTMTTAELQRHAALLYGRDPDGHPKHGWQKWLASRLPGKSGTPISRETIRLWMRADEVPEWAASMIRAMASIAPPPGSSSAEDRDDACREAIEPEMTRIRDLAISVGWHPAEVATAVLALTIDEIRDNAGDATAETLLTAALESIGGDR